MTRRALRPLSQTLAASPRFAHPARNGGKSSRSVSSSASTTLRGGKARICHRMRRFFLALWVRLQDIAGPLPDVVQPPQRPADGALTEAEARTQVQHLLEQRHGPTHVRVAEPLGRPRE